MCTGQRSCAPTGSASCVLTKTVEDPTFDPNMDDPCFANQMFCADTLCLERYVPGSACDGPGYRCQTANCVDGVCCDNACSGTCQACNLGTNTGLCTPYEAGEDPEDECGLGTCGTAGACGGCTSDADCKATAFCQGGTCVAKLGSGACVDASMCASGFCVDGACCNAACDGPCASCTTGTCQPEGQGAADPLCAGFLCNAQGACGTTCSSNAECGPSHACVDGACAPGNVDGTSCTLDADCASGACVAVAGGNVCCDSPCTGLCEACTAQGACLPAANGTDPKNDCADGTCDGQGNCKQVLLQFGVACADSSECQTGFCVDGYCCENGCDGKCVSCDLPGSEGLCLAAAAGTDPESECGDYQCAGPQCATACTSNQQCKDTCTNGVCGVPPVTYHYGPFTPWSGCGPGDVDETRTRDCLDSSGNTVGCDECIAMLGGSGCSETLACPPDTSGGGGSGGGGSGGGGGACTPLTYNVCVQSLADCQTALETRRLECVNTGCGNWTVTTSCQVGGSPSNASCWGAMATCGDVAPQICTPVTYNVCTFNGLADCQSTLSQLRTKCLTSGCTDFAAAACTIGGSPSNPNCWGAQANCGNNVAPPPSLCQWSTVRSEPLTSQPAGSFAQNGGFNGQGVAVVGGRVAWVGTSDWNNLYVPTLIDPLTDVSAVSVDVWIPVDVPDALGRLASSFFTFGVAESHWPATNWPYRGVGFSLSPSGNQLAAYVGPFPDASMNFIETVRVPSPVYFPGSWHRLRVEFSRVRVGTRYYVDGILLGTDYTPSDLYGPLIQLGSQSGVNWVSTSVGYSNLLVERGSPGCFP